MTTWHAPPGDLIDFARRPETMDAATASSLELHLLQCEMCREAVADAASPDQLAASWDSIADRVDQPAMSPVERLLRWLGVAETHARLVSATRSLQVAWLAAFALIVAGSVLIAHRVDSAGPFLVIAPIVPLLAVALAFSAGSEPAGEAAAAAPVSGVGLVLRRAAAVLIASLVVLVVGSVALPGLSTADAAWVLPALGLSLGGLALGTWTRVETAATVLGVGWLSALWVASAGASRLPVTELAPLAAPGQFACAALALLAVGVLAARRNTFALLGRIG